jgi:hypothetical protein
MPVIPGYDYGTSRAAGSPVTIDELRELKHGAKEFLAKKGHSMADVERMQQAWAKSVVLTLTLWSRPYVREGLW